MSAIEVTTPIGLPPSELKDDNGHFRGCASFGCRVTMCRRGYPNYKTQFASLVIGNDGVSLLDRDGE